MTNQSPNTGSPGHQNQPGGGSQTQHNPKPDRTTQPGQEHRPDKDKDRPNADPNRQGGGHQGGGGQDRGGSRSS
jgi:hypothetical protein